MDRIIWQKVNMHGRRHYTDRERKFYDARRAANNGAIVLAYFGCNHVERVRRFVTRKGVLIVETLSGESSIWNDLRAFSTLADVNNEIYRVRTQRYDDKTDARS